MLDTQVSSYWNISKLFNDHFGEPTEMTAPKSGPVLFFVAQKGFVIGK